MERYNSVDAVLKDLLPQFFALYWKTAGAQDKQAQLEIYKRAFTGTHFTFNDIARGMIRFMEIADGKKGRVKFPHPNRIKELLSGMVKSSGNQNAYQLMTPGQIMVQIWDDHPSIEIRKQYLKIYGDSQQAYESQAGLTQFKWWWNYFKNYHPWEQAIINQERQRIAQYNLENFNVRCCQPFQVFDETFCEIEPGKLYWLTDTQKQMVRAWYTDFEKNVADAVSRRKGSVPDHVEIDSSVVSLVTEMKF